MLANGNRCVCVERVYTCIYTRIALINRKHLPVVDVFYFYLCVSIFIFVIGSALFAVLYMLYFFFSTFFLSFFILSDFYFSAVRTTDAVFAVSPSIIFAVAAVADATAFGFSPFFIRISRLVYR